MTTEPTRLSAAERAIRASTFIAAAADSAGAEVTCFDIDDLNHATVRVDLPHASLKGEDGDYYDFGGFEASIVFEDQGIFTNLLNTGEDNGHYHPHVSSGHVCIGRYSEPIYVATKNEDWKSLFATIVACINTYSRDDCYQRVGIAYDTCDMCGQAQEEDRMSTCTDCDERLCEDCTYSCYKCGDSLCNTCLTYYDEDIWTGLGWLNVQWHDYCSYCHGHLFDQVDEVRCKLIALANTHERKMKLCGLIGMMKSQRTEVGVLLYRMRAEGLGFWTYLERGMKRNQRYYGYRKLPF